MEYSNKNKKQMFLCILLLCFSMIALAGNGDVLITRDGSFINVKVLKINNSDIRFINLNKKRLGELNAPTNFVYMIMKEKGNNIFFDEDGNQMTSPNIKLDKKDNVLFLNNGKFFPIFNVSINKDYVSYKLKNSKKAPVYQNSKEEIFLIKNEDGTTTLFNNKYVEKLRKVKAATQLKVNAAPSLPKDVTVPSNISSVPTSQETLQVVPQKPVEKTYKPTFSPASGMTDYDIINCVYAKKPYTLYGKGTVAEYVIMKDNVLLKFMGGPTYIQQIVADEKVKNGLLEVYVKQAFYNKKHEPSKGISATFKNYYYPTEIDTAGTFHLTHDISRDFYMLTSRKGYAILLPASFNNGNKIQSGIIVDEGKNLFGGRVSIKAEYNDFIVEGTEVVTTPAGDFECVRIKGNVSEENTIAVNKYQYTWWLARGVGFVKYEIKSNNAKVGESPLVIMLNKLERP